MNEFSFDALRAEAGIGLFPEEIEKHPWALFHGSSGQHFDAVSREGLYAQATFSRVELAELCGVFERLKWAGDHGGGYAVLRSFSLHDRADSDCPPIYLAETSTRALLYASGDWAGGEAARAVRHAVGDLSKREKELLPTERALALSLQGRAQATKVAHSFGVVYALVFDASDLQSLDYSNSFMGVRAIRPIAPSRIVGVVRIPSDWVQVVGPDARRIERIFEPGILTQLCGKSPAV